MAAEELSAQIELLVDHLRGRREHDLSLTDVASVTEVLIGTMRRYFAGIDTSIYRECRQLADYISNARKEIASLEPGDLEHARIPRAGLELDAIVRQTEEATNTIMTSAEAIMGADPADVVAFQSTVEQNILEIFEACSFQDITGQRISKVVQTLAHVESRINELRKLLGITDDEIASAREEAAAGETRDPLLSGPSLEGEGIDQDEVDALMEPGKARPVANSADSPAKAPASQDDIDALFD